VALGLEKFGLRYYNPNHLDFYKNYTGGVLNSGHYSLESLVAAEILHEKVVDTAYKFGFVRNPWDRLVSLYTYMKKVANQPNGDRITSAYNLQSFDAFVKTLANNPITPIGNYNLMGNSQANQQLSWLSNSKGEINVDFVGKFESIGKDWDELCKNLGINADLPHRNKTKHRPFRNLYNTELIDVVGNLYSDDILKFDYTFE
jgi:chondroitin 4-sulfotransferase 11